ncbi:rod shape-determining protein MreD [Methylovorus mays]|uniref:rod shape-determining protein MreD n=1 Tax=Methylovorus mays TaxID=184077 RepID=UPI001E555B4F|nr:rod shape-determining protein MreD [Methylovorus mays]MCB5208055.1 rod shape-determining protein MreD [Methylovorus mays]
MRPNLSTIYLTLLAALLCQLLPWSGIALTMRPDFVLLVLLYWLLRAPHLCNIGTAWFAGLVIDLATGGLFGQAALAYALTAFFALIYQRRLTLFNIWQQAAYVFALLVFNQGTLLILKMFAGGESPGWGYFYPCITGIMLWLAVIFTRLGIQGHTDQD